MVNDMSIVYGITVFFVILGVIAPFFNESFSGFATAENDPNSLTGDLDPDDAKSAVNAFRVISSVVSMFFWSFEVPTWANLIIFLPIRILFILIIARNVWIGGGG